MSCTDFYVWRPANLFLLFSLGMTKDLIEINMDINYGKFQSDSMRLTTKYMVPKEE
jgi:hypothetical protein